MLLAKQQTPSAADSTLLHVLHPPPFAPALELGLVPSKGDGGCKAQILHALLFNSMACATWILRSTHYRPESLPVLLGTRHGDFATASGASLPRWWQAWAATVHGLYKKHAEGAVTVNFGRWSANVARLAILQLWCSHRSNDWEARAAELVAVLMACKMSVAGVGAQLV